MTFKNVKFDDSAVMRSLEKLAVKKGLVEPETIKKEASSAPKHTLKATGDLTQDLLKLCDALRKAGFSKYADDVETKFVQLKKAESLYETSKETGEAFLDGAHPEGSVKLKDMDGDATVETVADIKKKIEDLVKKTPKGKLANQDFINLVKITLAEGNENKESLETEIDINLQEALRRWNIIDNMIRKDGNLVNGLGFMGRGMEYNTQASYIRELLITRPATLDNLNSLKKRISGLLSIIKPGTSIMGGSFNPWGGVTEDVYSTVAPIIGNLNSFVDRAYQARIKINTISSKEIESGPVAIAPKREGVTVRDQFNESTFDALYNEEMGKLKVWTSKIQRDAALSNDEKNGAVSWLSEQMNEIAELKETIMANPVSLAPAYQRLQAITKENNQFYNEWVA